MLTWAHLILAAANLGLVAWGVCLYRRSPSVVQALILLPICFFGYNNLILGIGGWVGEGAILLALSWSRYLALAFFAPLWLPAGLILAARAGAPWAAGRGALAVALGAMVLLVALGIYQEIGLQRMVLVEENGVVSYRNIGRGGPPLPAHLLTVTLLGFGLAMWRRKSWPWLGLGALFILVVAEQQLLSCSVLLTNCGQFLLAIAMLAAARRFAPATLRRPRFRAVITVPLR